MASSVTDECCVASLKEPVQVLTLATASSASPQGANDLKLFSDGASLDKYLSSSAAQAYTCRFMCVCPEVAAKERPRLSKLASAQSANATLGARCR